MVGSAEVMQSMGVTNYAISICNRHSIKWYKYGPYYEALNISIGNVLQATCPYTKKKGQHTKYFELFKCLQILIAMLVRPNMSVLIQDDLVAP